MIVLLTVFSKTTKFNEILYEKSNFLKYNFKKRCILLLILNYLNKRGEKYMFELLIFRLFFLIKKTSLLKIKYLFNKNESSLFILHHAFFNVMPSFKLILKDKKEYIPLSFSDLMKDHSQYLTENALLDDHKFSKYSKNRLKNLKSLPASKNPLNFLVNMKIIPVPLNSSSRCFKCCSFLFQSLLCYNDTINFAEKLYQEIILSYYCCGRSFYLKTEVDKIACFHKSNVQF